MKSRPRRLVAGVLATAISIGATPAISASQRASDAIRAGWRCEGGSAVRSSASGLDVVVGTCPAESADGLSPTGTAPRAETGPADCLVPGYDDRCEAWTASRYDGPWASRDFPGFGSFDRHTTILPHPTKDLLFVGGTSDYTNGGLPDADFVQIAYRASTGQSVWTSVYEGLDELTLAYETSIALSPDGERLYAIGIAAEPGVYDYSPVIAAFETTTGNRLWARRAPIYAEAIETSLTTLPGGTPRERIYLAGTSSATVKGSTVATASVAALDPSNGSELWTSKFPGQTDYGSRFNELAITADGSTIYAGGGEHLPNGLVGDFLTVAFRANDGGTLWAARDSRTQPDGFFGSNGISDLKVTPDGSRVVIAGFDPVSSNQIRIPSTSPILTIAHDGSTGEVAWRKTYGGPVPGETHFYFSLFQGMMALSPDGTKVVVTAAINSGDSTATVAYDIATGNQLWGIESVDRSVTVTGYLGYYPSVVVSNDAAFVSNKRGIGYSQARTVTQRYALDDGGLGWTARLGTNRTLYGGNALSPDGDTVFVTAADQLYSVGFPAPNPGLDTVDILTVSYSA